MPDFELGRLTKDDGTPFSATYLKKTITGVNAYLEEMSRGLGSAGNPDFRDSCVHLVAHDGGRRFSLCWRPYHGPSPVAHPAGPPRARPPRWKVVVLGKLMETQFSADLMQGARSMARELGADLVDRRTWDDAEMKEEILDVATKGDPKRHAVVFYFVKFTQPEFAKAAYPLEREDKQFKVIHAGYDLRGSISIDYGVSASLIVKHLCSLFPPSQAELQRKVVILPQFEGLPEGHPLRIRDAVYRSRLEDSDQFTVKSLKLEYTFRSDSITSHGLTLIKEAIRKDGEGEIVAILGRSHRITRGVIECVRACKRGPGGRAPILVLGENIATDLLLSLNDPDDPLEAICSADSFHLGRYIVRAALAKLCGPEIPLPNIMPVLLTKEDVRAHKLFTIDRLPAMFKGCDLRLDAPEYAWQPWMQVCCPCGYGPHLHKRTRTTTDGL